MRSLLTDGTAGNDVWSGLAWILGILIVSYALALSVYRRSDPVPAGQ